jgi:hypothetical protein
MLGHFFTKSSGHPAANRPHILLQGCQMVYFYVCQKSQFGYILEGLGMDNVGIFYDFLNMYFTAILVYFMAVWHNLLPFNTYIFSVFVCLWTKKNLATLFRAEFFLAKVFLTKKNVFVMCMSAADRLPTCRLLLQFLPQDWF